jgi:hypothetical protein
MLAQALMA